VKGNSLHLDRILAGAKSTVVGLASIGWFYGLAPLRRNIFWALHHILAPISFLFFIYLYGGSKSIVFALAGGFVTVTIGTSITIETDAAFNRIVLKLQEIYVASPISPIAYVLGLAVSNAISALPGLAIFMGLSVFLLDLNAVILLTLFLTLTLTWTVFSFTGYIISTVARDMKDLWIWSPIITTLISFLPPVFYPAELLPEQFRWVVFVIPSAAASRLLQASFNAVNLAPAESMLLWLSLTAYAIAAAVAMLGRMRWRL